MKIRIIFLLLFANNTYSQKPSVNYEQLAFDYFVCNYNSFSYDTAGKRLFYDTFRLSKKFPLLRKEQVEYYSGFFRLPNRLVCTADNELDNSKVQEPNLAVSKRSDGLVICDSGNYKSLGISTRFYIENKIVVFIVVVGEYIKTDIVLLMDRDGKIIRLCYVQGFVE